MRPTTWTQRSWRQWPSRRARRTVGTASEPRAISACTMPIPVAVVSGRVVAAPSGCTTGLPAGDTRPIHPAFLLDRAHQFLGRQLHVLIRAGGRGLHHAVTSVEPVATAQECER